MTRLIRFVSLALVVMLLLSGCPDAFRDRPDDVDDETPADNPGDNGDDPGEGLSYEVTWAGAGAIGQDGGVTFTATMQASGTGALYWGVSDDVPLGIALDGAIDDDDGETLVFDDDASDLGAGRLVFAGEAVVELHDSTTRTFETRMTITVTDASALPLELVPAADLGFVGIGGMLLIYDSGDLLEGFTLNIIAEGKDGIEWVPVAVLYNELETPEYLEEQVQVQYLGIFYEMEG